MSLFGGNSDTSLKTGVGAYKKSNKSDICGTYYRFLEMPTSRFQAHNCTTQLEVLIKGSIELATREPESGEAHRIFNRLIGKPRETQVNVSAKVHLSESSFAKAIAHIRETTTPPNDDRIIEGHAEEGVALEEPKKKGRPRKFATPRPLSELMAPTH